ARTLPGRPPSGPDLPQHPWRLHDGRHDAAPLLRSGGRTGSPDLPADHEPSGDSELDLRRSPPAQRRQRYAGTLAAFPFSGSVRRRANALAGGADRGRDRRDRSPTREGRYFAAALASASCGRANIPTIFHCPSSFFHTRKTEEVMTSRPPLLRSKL